MDLCPKTVTIELIRTVNHIKRVKIVLERKTKQLLEKQGLLLYRSEFAWVHNNLEENYFKNNVGKGENAGNQHFVLFPQYFRLTMGQNIITLSSLHLVSL